MVSIWIIWRWSFWQFINTLIDQYSPNTPRRVYDPYKDSPRESTLQEVCSCDILFLAVPIRNFEQTLIDCKSHIGENTILIDVCTIKVYSQGCLQKYLPNQSYLCTHPMFGPYSYAQQWTLKDLRLVICSHTLSNEEYEKILSLTRLLQLTVVECSADQHDQMLARSLFLTHYLTQIVVEAGLENTQIDTISFGNLMDVVASVRNDTQLFHDVRTYNPYCKKLVDQFSLAKKSIDKRLDTIL